MILGWGTYRFLQSEAATDISRERVLDTAGIAWAETERWTIHGKVLNPSGSLGQMTTRLQQLEAAFTSGSKDLVLYLPDGTTPSAHALRTGETLGGTRVVSGVQYADSSGANYVTYRDFSVTVEALKAVDPTNRSPLVAFQTSIQFTGGGPLTYHHEPLTGRPIKALGKEQTVWRATQQGSAVGMSARPSPLVIDPPIWPEDEMRPLRVFTPGHPRRVGNTFVEWPVSWQYVFQSADELSGSPALWTF